MKRRTLAELHDRAWAEWHTNPTIVEYTVVDGDVVAWPSNRPLALATMVKQAAQSVTDCLLAMVPSLNQFAEGIRAIQEKLEALGLPVCEEDSSGDQQAYTS